MKSVKWFYVGAMAIALGMLTFATIRDGSHNLSLFQ